MEPAKVSFLKSERLASKSYWDFWTQKLTKILDITRQISFMSSHHLGA
jgi:hypothetical protein